MKRILFATDLSARSDRAFERALALAKETGAELHVLYVIDEDLPSRIATELSEATRSDISKRLTAWGKDDHAEIHVEVGQPWMAIVQQARDLEADLIVVGTHKNHGIADLFTGTTLERVAKFSDTPVLLVRNPATGPYGSAIVGVDFSPMAQRTVEVAARVAPGAELTLVHAYRIPFKGLTMRTDAGGDITKRDRDAIERPLAAAMTSFAETLDCAPRAKAHRLCEGGAISALEQEVRNCGADLLALGVHARSPLVVGLLGSTATDAMSSPPCDVLLVPAARQEAAGASA
jgi:nucleotide-binding universal stress UspA family protein